MGLATIDLHNQKEHTEIHKIPKFWCLSGKFLLRYSDLKTSKFTKKCMAIRTLCRRGTYVQFQFISVYLFAIMKYNTNYNNNNMCE